jgi:cobalamin biosynthesis protein CobT
LVDTNKDDKLDSEIAKRLDDLFGEGDASSGETSAMKANDATTDENKSQNQPGQAADDEIFELEDVASNKTGEGRRPADYPLAELKNMVLSIDWEITDEVLAGFLSQIDGLKNTYKKEKIILMFLQLLGSLGEYIKTNRGNAHPKTFKILNSVFARLEDVVLSHGMSELEKKKILRTEMNKYKQLRKQVSKKKATAVGRRQAKLLQKDETDVSAPKKQKAGMPSDKVPATAKSHDSLAEAIEELKQFIHSELSALRQELKIFHKSK